MARVGEDLVFDLGMNDGADAADYLGRGYDVIAVEPDPALCRRARARFAAEIAGGRLAVVEAAVWSERGVRPFYVSARDDWSSLDPAWAGRDGTLFAEIEVRCVTLTDLFAEFGVPHYMKVDVEGADGAIVDQLCGVGALPRYVSVEDCRRGPEYVAALARAGYDRFHLVDQPEPAPRRFGTDLAGRWLDQPAFMALYHTMVRAPDGRRLAPQTQWWDIHCARVA